MPRETKVFEVSVRDPEDVEEFPFQLKFTRLSSGESWPEDFAARIRSMAFTDLTVGSVVRIVDGRTVTDASAIMPVFQRFLSAEDFNRLDALIRDDALGIELQVLGDIAKWLMEEYTGRPTRRSSSSSTGPRPTGDPSTGSLSSVG